VWHLRILETQDYAQLCGLPSGQFLHRFSRLPVSKTRPLDASGLLDDTGFLRPASAAGPESGR
jgi:hypothetical protein